MPGQTGSDQKGKGAEKERKRYVNSDLVHPCNPVSFHVAHIQLMLTPGTLIIVLIEVQNDFIINRQKTYYMSCNELCKVNSQLSTGVT